MYDQRDPLRTIPCELYNKIVIVMAGVLPLGGKKAAVPKAGGRQPVAGKNQIVVSIGTPLHKIGHT